MPTRPPRSCAFCGARAPGGGRCPNCRATEQRQTRQARGYTNSWIRYAQRWRLRFPFCGQRADGNFHGAYSACVRAGRRRLGELVDHIHPVAAGGDFWDPRNHQTLCRECHALKTRIEVRERPRGLRA